MEHLRNLPSRQLVAKLPKRGRAQLAAAVLVDLLVRTGLVVLAVLAVGHSRTVAAAAAGALLLVTGFQRWLGGLLRRSCRIALYDASIDALLSGPVLATDRRNDHDSLLAVAQSLWIGETLMSATLPGILGDLGASVLLGIFLAARMSLRTVALGMAIVSFVAVAVLAARAVTTRASARAERAFDPVFNALIAAHQARLELVAAGRDRALLADARSQLERWRRIASRADLLAGLAGRAPILIATIATAAAVLLDETVRGAFTAAATRDALIVGAAVPALVGFTHNAAEFARASAKVRPLVDLFTYEAVAANGEGFPLPQLPAPIDLHEVSFAYRSEKGVSNAVLCACSLTWQPGEILLVRGPNGSGKSTLLRVLLGLARPQHGSVTVGGEDLFALDLRSWRSAVAYLPQRPFFRDQEDVREAVRFMVPGAADSTIEQALDRVGLLSSLRGRHPADPLRTPVGTLSAGQRQRLALARVLCRDSRVILLDEPDANLDQQGVDIMAELLRDLARDRMIAVAAHTCAFVPTAHVLATFSPGAPVRVLRSAGNQAASGGDRA